MASVKKIMSSGISPATAKSIVGDIAPELTATGTSQATALLLNNDVNRFGTVAINTGCILNVDFESVFIFNDSAETLLLYPPVGGSIDGGTTDSPVPITTGSRVMVFRGNTAAPDYVTFLGA